MSKEDLLFKLRGPEPMGSWIRLKLAYLLDEINTTCWFSLALWALFPRNHDFWEILHPPVRGSCERMGDYPYCGKCEVLGSFHDWHRAETFKLRQIFAQKKT